ncbi:GlxA family transcriptional regulator [Phenylobacterium soli]|uniref:GlxA family transcriptional regulator n=1 Tax=Phenylobacterium soli TaxID=2170551 RepID=A0A328AAA8_9CAUL|nr:GlxA family transcriptional regulator [Phenylobacterium soli]RAK51663.1 GlxA family transcriptional regulator [Phenylobacterium soli]
MTRRVAFVIFPDFQLLDAAGPISAFEIAGRYRPGTYDFCLLAPQAGMVASTSGAALGAAALCEGPFDTIIMSGGEGSRDYAQLGSLLDWLKREAPRARRVASVCSGAYLLAKAGLLDARRATTHWNSTDHFAQEFPAVRLEPDRIFTRDGLGRDGEIWTSAGITAGIDLALALIEDDLGAKVARRTAQQLVVHHRRPGGQSQFSALLDTGGVHGRFAGLMDWIRERLAEPLSVERLADQAAMSPRNFARAFRAETGLTPAKAVERLRLEAARLRVEASAEPIDRVAEAVGFGDPERMRRAFLRAFGQPPQALRRAARA